MKLRIAISAAVGLLFVVATSPVTAAPIIINEYNAVAPDGFLKGGTAEADEDGGQRADSTLGRVAGNGGDWFELVTIAHPLDIRGWQIKVTDQDGTIEATLTLSNNTLLSNLSAGTIITVAEDIAEDASYDPLSGDWTIHLQAGSEGSGAYISTTPFDVSNNDTSFEIRDASGHLIFGPNGEGPGSPSGVNPREVAKLEADPLAAITADSDHYNDGSSSTFGQPNIYSAGTATQDFTSLRTGLGVGDGDLDGVATCRDNCPETFNVAQLDADQDGNGDTCDADQGGTPGPGLPEGGCEEADIFDPDELLEVAIYMSEADWEALRLVEPNLWEYFPATCPVRPSESIFPWYQADVVVGGVTITDVGVRKKGFYGSTTVPTRPSLKVKFSEYQENIDLFGLDRLTLNGAPQDSSLVRTCLSYKLFREAGVPAPRCNHAHVRIIHENGEVDLGVYSHVESIKDPFLERVFGDSDGNLYEAQLADFQDDLVLRYDMKNNRDSNDGSDIWAIRNVVWPPGTTNATVMDDSILGDLGDLVDLDDFLTFWAMEGLIGHWDGYSGNQNNHYVYHDPSDGKFRFIPWGTDGTWSTGHLLQFLLQGDQREGFPSPLFWAYGIIARRLYEIPSMAEAYGNRLETLMDTLWDEEALNAEIDRVVALVSPVQTPQNFGVSRTREFINTRQQVFDEAFGGELEVWEGTDPMGSSGRVCMQPGGLFNITPCPTCGYSWYSAPCHGAIAKAGSLLVKKSTKALLKCRDSFNSGATLFQGAAGAEPITDFDDCWDETKVAATVSKSGLKARKKVSSRCMDGYLDLMTACSRTVDGLVNATGDDGCIIDTHLDEVDSAIEALYGPSLAPEQSDLARCQSSIGKAGYIHLTKTLKAHQKCRSSFTKGKALYRDSAKTEPLAHSAGCTEEYKTARMIAKAGAKARKLVGGSKCSDALVGQLDACASTVDGLVSPDGSGGCLIEDQRAAVTTMLRKQYCDELICP